MAIHTGLALFAGGGGLELGLSLALGTDYKAVAYVEREATSAAVLAANMERGWLDKAPIWDDVTTFTGDAVSPLVDNIDIISAGFPCQPWSVAGSRKGTEDERWLWPLIFRLVREIRPRSIFLENVPGLLHGGIEHVLGDLASVGFDAEWTSVRASDVGAPHRRERVFILASRDSEHSDLLERGIRGESDTDSRTVANSSNLSGQVSSPSRAGRESGAVAAGTSGTLGNAQSLISERQQPEGTGRGQSEGQVGNRSGNVDDTNNQGLQGWRWNSERGNEWLAWPPSPSDSDAWARIPERYWPAVKPDLRHRIDGTERGLARSDKLRILGNSVVPQQAALAYTLLRERLAAPHR